MSTPHKNLALAEAQARLNLAAAIINLDERQGHIAAGAPVDTENEQAALEQAKDAYTQSLAAQLGCAAIA